MKKIIYLTFFLTLISCSPKPDINAVNNFIVISIDALHPDAITEKYSPYILSLMRKGSGTLNGTSVKPPLTLYNHTAMFIGLTTEESGQNTNNWQPGDKPVKHKTIFQSAYRNGLNTGYFYAKPKLGYLVTDDIKKFKFSGR